MLQTTEAAISAGSARVAEVEPGYHGPGLAAGQTAREHTVRLSVFHLTLDFFFWLTWSDSQRRSIKAATGRADYAARKS